MKYCLWLLCFIWCVTIIHAQSYSLYIAPQGNDSAAGTTPATSLRSIQKAQERVRACKAQYPTDSVFVYFASGTYSIIAPLGFAPKDGGTLNAPVTYTALPGNEVIWNGGKRITGWQKYKNNTWVASLKEVMSDGWSFSQLYVNGTPRRRARLPDTGFYRVKGFPDGGLETGYQTKSRRFEYKPGNINPNWKNKNDIDIVVYHFWTDTHLTVDSIDDKKHIVSFKYPSGKVFTDDFNNAGARYVAENVWEGLRQPGDWYLDKKEGMLYYIPLKDEDMNTAAVYAPVTPAFINMTGDAVKRNFVTNLHFNGIQFQYANVQLPKGDVNDAQGSSSLAAVITLKGAQGCSFTNCIIKNIGGFAIELQEGCSDNLFNHNQLSNLAGGGIRINGSIPPAHPLLQTHDNIISNNDIGPYGLQYPSAVGVLLMQTYSNQVVHNLIHDGYYTGVSVGWEWGYQHSISRDNLVAFNHIHHIGQGLLSDMGAIYTLGVSPGTILRNNLIHDVDAHNYGGWGIYNDEGSTGILVENNIVYNTKFAGYNIHYAKEITVRNNIFAFGRLQQLNRTRVEPHKSVFFENNIVYWKEGVLFDGNWQDKPYSFYFNPNKDGIQQVNSTFDIDYNVYFNPLLPVDSITCNQLSWQQWQQKGNDIHSLYSDPLFIDPQHYNFSLSPGSPAFKSGFQAIDMSGVGVIRDSAR